MERTVTISLAETRIVLLCRDCQTKIAYDAKSWAQGDTQCPKCKKQDQNRIEEFRAALRAVIDNQPELPFDVRIEVQG